LRESLLRLLTLKTNSDEIWQLMEAMAKLHPTAEDQRRARERLLELLPAESNAMASWGLAQTLADLTPTADDLAGSHSWANAPPTELLSAIRRNSSTLAWLAVLPSLAGLRWELRIS
jgi:hypothetical protein